MNSLKKTLVLLCAMSVVTASAYAGAPTLTFKERFKTVFSLGVQWDFGDSQAQLALAARRTETNSQNQVFGGKTDLLIPLKMDSFSPTVRLLGVGGSRDIQAEVGLGWQIATSRLVNSVGVQAPYSNVGVNYVWQDGFKPYAGVNTISRAPARTPVILNNGGCC